MFSAPMPSMRDWPAEGSRPELRVLVSHGRGDSVVPFSIGESLRDVLRARGDRVEWLEHAGGHRMPASARRAAARFLADVAAAEP